jgi:hypothetical protein
VNFLADKEWSLGLADERLLSRALSEAGGNEAQARQIYWRLRATDLKKAAEESSTEFHIMELKESIRLQEKRALTRKERNRWFWALVCFASILGTVIFPWLAVSAFARNRSIFYFHAFMGVACLVLVIIAYTASTYHTHTD